MRSQGLRGSKGFSLLEVVVAVAILGITVVTLLEIFSINLRTVRKSEDYTKALIFARSMMDEAYAIRDPEEATGYFESGQYQAERGVSLVSKKEGTRIYEIYVRVTWPPNKSLSLNGRRILYERKKK